MDLSKLKVKVKNKAPKRLGRGVGSGKGKTSGRGHKGSGQRKGKKTPYLGFKGGNFPLYRRIPKRGFNSPKKKEYQIVNLKDIEKKIKDVGEVNPKVLKEVNLIKNEKKLVKILGSFKGNFPLKAVFKADKFTSGAKQIIEKAGGQIGTI